MEAIATRCGRAAEGWEREEADAFAAWDATRVHQGTVEKSGQLLYGVVIEHFDLRRRYLRSTVEYIHAAEEVEAKWHFQLMYPDRRTHRIAYAAPCIGFYVENSQGTVVSAT